METVLFAGRDKDFVDRFREKLACVDPEAHAIAVRMEDNLRRLALVFRDLSTILGERLYGDAAQSVGTLVDLLLKEGSDHAILLPTKVSVGRSLLVAKFNYLGFVWKVSVKQPSFQEYRNELQLLWESVIFLLLVEDVYQVIIGREGWYTRDLRRKAATDLIHLWEYRSDRNVAAYAHLIMDLWRARRYVAPVFGTMAGTVELLRISSLLSEDWHRFLSDHAGDPGTVLALEEFIFGLSCEEIADIRASMFSEGLRAIDRQSISLMLRPGKCLPDINGFDPRELYRFHQKRLSACDRRSLLDLPGSRRTLEEILLCFLLETGGR